MAHRKKNRHVGIVGIGETKFSSHREDVNQPEMIHEELEAPLNMTRVYLRRRSDSVNCDHGNPGLLVYIHISHRCK